MYVDPPPLCARLFKQVRCIVHLPPARGASSDDSSRSQQTPRRRRGGGDDDGGSAAAAAAADLSVGGAFPLSATTLARSLPHGPRDLQLSFRASGLLGADVFRGVRLVLDLANRRVAVCQHAAAAKSNARGW